MLMPYLKTISISVSIGFLCITIDHIDCTLCIYAWTKNKQIFAGIQQELARWKHRSGEDRWLAKKMRKLLLDVGVRSQGHSCTTMRKIDVIVGVILLDL